MERIPNDERFQVICRAGQGVVFNDFSGRGASAAQYNVLHVASCAWLRRSNTNVAKLWFADLATATDWLTRERGAEGQGWKRCGTCHAAGAAAPTSGAPPRTSPAALPAEPHGDDPTYAVVGTDRLVEAWSSSRLPFEPTGAMREFRDELRRKVGRMSGGPGEALHAVYTSDVTGHFDVENVLLYNVGPSAFAAIAGEEIAVERAFGPLPPPPAGLDGALHHHRYAITPSGSPWRAWYDAGTLASIGPVDLGRAADLSRAARVWHAVRRAMAPAAGTAEPPTRFGLDLVLETPAGARVNLAEIAKPLLDGVVAAFHAHDDEATLDLVAGRLATQLDVSADEVRALLGADGPALLGPRRLLWPWGEGVQWNPADDRCLAFRIRCVPRSIEDGHLGTVGLRGALVAIESPG